MIIIFHDICTKNNIPFGVTNKTFDSRNDVSIWMIKNQFGRRNLIPFVRTELALKLEGLFKHKALKNNVTCSFDKLGDQEKTPCQNSDKPPAKNNQVVEEFNDTEEQNPNEKPERAQDTLKLKDDLPKIKPIDTKKELAKIAGVSHDTIERVKTIQAKALVNKQIAAEDMNTQKRQNIEETICQNSDKMQGRNIDKFDEIFDLYVTAYTIKELDENGYIKSGEPLFRVVEEGP